MGQGLPWSAAVLVGLLLGGCSGTPFGEQLSRSFSAPRQESNQPATSNANATAPAKPAQPPANAKPPVDAAPAPAELPRSEPIKAVQAMPPAPYRITIQLPAADPSAPAEVVTEALRRAGVPFEVERIERVSNTGPGTAAAPPAATPRPAPAPRPR